LIDVVFMLLMFFMLTSTFVKWKSITLSVPVASGAKTSAQEDLQFIVLHDSGVVSFYGETTQKKQSVSIVLPQVDATKTLLVLPEENTSVQLIVRTLEQLKAAGVTRLSLGKSVAGSSTSASLL
jgi:biopolymer transport protein ExbD